MARVFKAQLISIVIRDSNARTNLLDSASIYESLTLFIYWLGFLCDAGLTLAAADTKAGIYEIGWADYFELSPPNG